MNDTARILKRVRRVRLSTVKNQRKRKNDKETRERQTKREVILVFISTKSEGKV